MPFRGEEVFLTQSVLMAELDSAPQLSSPEEPSATSPDFLKPESPVPTSPPPKARSAHDFEESSRPGKRPKLDLPPMTAAAAIAEAQQKPRQGTPGSRGTSPNPAQEALNALMGASQNATSNAPLSTSTPPPPNPATTMSEAMAVVAETTQVPSPVTIAATTAAEATATEGTTAGGDHQVTQTSPVSVSSIGSLESMAAVPSGLTTTVGSPLPIDETARPVPPAAAAIAEPGSTSPGDSLKAFSYPAPLLQANENTRRGMSLPGSGTRQGTRSPSSKKHRCPYCATEFTRHHNLKSHLLTHSQEKPYVCSTCQSRFRRLHDLKRHTKLHTGERPHICPKCGRKFARGDALARHNKGPGGCAGRRASMGSFAGEEDYEGGDDSMDAVMYHEPEGLEDEEGNAKRPGIRRHAPSGDDTGEDQEHFSRIPSTYPPIQGRPPGGIASGVFPPRSGFVTSSAGPAAPSAAMSPGAGLPYPHPSSSSSSGRPGGHGGSAFAQNLLTESPKPLSPGQSHHTPARGPGPAEASLTRNRSSSMTHYQQQQQPPPPPPPYTRSASGHGSSLGVPSGPQLPPPHSLNPPDPRFTLPSQGGPAHPPTQPSGPPTHMSGSGPLSSHSNSLSSHGHSGHGSGETNNPMFAKEDRIWAVVKSLEQRISLMQEGMNLMQEEINVLRTQLANATQMPQSRIA